MRHLENLNEAQHRAVLHTDGPLLIFAGAGSGKTRVLTCRIANLLLSGAATPYGVLAVTFTNKAAKEMKERVQALLPAAAPEIWVSTFHSTCARILRRHATLLDYSARFAIYDSSDSLALMKRVFRTLQVDDRSIDPRGVLRRIDRAKNDYLFPDDFRDNPEPSAWDSTFADLYEAYQEELRQADAMDFGDLLCNTVSLFQLEPDLLASFQQRFTHLLVDEYQDTNHVQYLLIKMLAEKHENLCVVGDDDQSIYAFRGASVQNILNFRNDFPEAESITLDLNYRSTKHIITAANSVIAKNRKREVKQMRTILPEGELLVRFAALNEKDEAQFVARQIRELADKGLDLEDCAVFYRTNAQSRSLEEAFGAHGIPYRIFGGFRFYDRKEIKDLLAYYRLLLNPRDNEAFLRIINSPTRGIGAASLKALQKAAVSLRLPLLPALETALKDAGAGLPKNAVKKFAAFYQLISELRVEAQRAETALAACIPDGSETGEKEPAGARSALADLFRAIAEQSGYLTHLEKQDPEEGEDRKENVFELFNVALDFVEATLADGRKATLQEFLDRAGLASDLDSENTTSNAEESEEKVRPSAVSLMTLHLAKGLEYTAVFLVGLEEGLLPHNRSLDDRSAIEEERRLCYVGITRAKEKLFLSYAGSRRNFPGRGPYNGWGGTHPSRFLADIPAHLVESRQSDIVAEEYLAEEEMPSAWDW